MTLEEAVSKFRNNYMDAIPTRIIGKLWQYEPDSICEVTLPCAGDRVYDYESDESGEIESVRDDIYTIRLDGGTTVKRKGANNFEVEYDEALPMWGTMWSFKDWVDNYWLENCDGIRIMSECGFRIYEHEEFGYFFGIDGAGYSFYEPHFLPLYKARGIKWHDAEE